jgi:hypothetical protein
MLEKLPTINVHGAQAFNRYASIIKESELRRLLDAEATVFLGGSVTNQAKFYPYFDQIFGLVLAKGPLETRLAHRTNNPTGNNPADREYLLSINDRIEANLKDAGAIMIDAGQPLNDVVDEILNHVQ